MVDLREVILGYMHALGVKSILDQLNAADRATALKNSSRGLSQLPDELGRSKATEYKRVYAALKYREYLVPFLDPNHLQLVRATHECAYLLHELFKYEESFNVVSNDLLAQLDAQIMKSMGVFGDDKKSLANFDKEFAAAVKR